VGDLTRGAATAAGWIREGRVAALTGAGISVDSGIPDFRSAGGLWARYEPMEYATIEAFRRSPDRVWNMLREMGRVIEGARPNAGHEALAGLEARGLLEAIVTQNVDDLHQAAGSKEVIEFHGNARDIRCALCGDRATAPLPDAGDRAPRCNCGGVLRPMVVFFGEPIPPGALDRATEAAASCRTMLVVGTSATVAPASLIPMLAKRAGARLIEINLERTALSGVADLALVGRSATEVLPEILRALDS
jgi:NAD-dependent deacetylase